MGRSLSWINKQKLGSLFQQMGHQKPQAESEQASSAEEKPSSSYFRSSFDEQPFPFDQHAKKHLKPQVDLPLLSVPGSTDTPTQLETAPAEISQFKSILDAKKRWEEENILPLAPEVQAFPLCLSAFVEWLVTTTEGHAAFLANHEGLPLATFGTTRHTTALSASFVVTEQILEACRSASSSHVGALEQVIIPLSSDETWHIGWVQSSLGRIAWGVNISSILSIPVAESISSILVAVMNASATN